MGLVTRQTGPNAKGSKLTATEMDNNLYYLQSLGVSGVTYSANTLTITNPTGGTKSVTISADTNTFITGSSYNNTTNTIELTDNNNTSFDVYIDGFSGMTVNGTLSATTISGGTLYGDGSNLTGIGDGYTETIVNITSAQILGGFNAIECLPANSINQLYDIEYITYYCNNANYTITGTFGMYINGLTFLFNNELLNDGIPTRTITGKNPHSLRTSSNVPVFGFLRGDRNINIGIQSGSAPTGGTGDITLKIKWKLIDVN